MSSCVRYPMCPRPKLATAPGDSISRACNTRGGSDRDGRDPEGRADRNCRNSTNGPDRDSRTVAAGSYRHRQAIPRTGPTGTRGDTAGGADRHDGDQRLAAGKEPRF